VTYAIEFRSNSLPSLRRAYQTHSSRNNAAVGSATPFTRRIGSRDSRGRRNPSPVNSEIRPRCAPNNYMLPICEYGVTELEGTKLQQPFVSAYMFFIARIIYTTGPVVYM